MQIDTIVLDAENHVTLTAFLQDVGGEYRGVSKRPGLIVIPGGGYLFVSDREAEPVVWPYLNAGYDVFVLRYTVGEKSAWPRPLQDYEMAFAAILALADSWHLDRERIAVAGFSAGGHLAGAAATVSKYRPAAAILGYAVLNETVDEINQDAPRIYECVTKDTCPCFLFASRSDNVVPIRNTIDMLSALEKNGISFETHIYAGGPHGFSTGEMAIQGRTSSFCPRIPDWVGDSIGFLKDVFGELTTEGMTKPRYKARVDGDQDAFLSFDCTIGRIFSSPAAKEAIQPLIDRMRREIRPDRPDMTLEEMLDSLKRMNLRDLCMENQIPISPEMEEALEKVPNI